MLRQMASMALMYAESPVRAATSAMPAYMYPALTAWPTASSCSVTGLWLWLYSRLVAVLPR